MKILMDARALGMKPSGVGMYIYNLASELMKISGYEIELVTDVCESDEMKSLEAAGMSIHKYGKRVAKSLSLYSYYRYVQKMVMEAKPDIFWEGNNLTPVKIRNPYGQTWVTIHDVFPVTHPEAFSRKYCAYFRFGMGRTVRNYDVLIYNSQESKESTESSFKKALGKCSYVGYIIVPRLPARDITDNGAYLYIGNLEKRKGSDILLRAYARYKELGGTRRLRLGGSVREGDIEIILGQTKEKTGTIDYLGYLDLDKKCDEYASCHAMVFPSRAEGFGIPVIEAMNYGKDIIASDLSIFHEIAGEDIDYYREKNGEGDIEALAAKLIEHDHKYMKYIESTHDYSTILDRYTPESIISGFQEIIDRT